MASDPSFSEREAAIEHEAAAWLARRERGLTALEQDEFFQWLANDPRHGDWVARHQQTVAGLQLLAQWRPEHGSRPNPDLLAAPKRTRASGSLRPVYWFVPIGLAAAAAVALVLWRPAPSTPRASGTQVPYVEAPPIVRKVLEDGSTIDLNRGAVVEVNYTPDRRDVHLVKGEANFSVAKNHERPFIVTAGSVQVRAVGTAFNVDLMAKSVEVLVTEGRVQVSQPDPTSPASSDTSAPPAIPILEAGQRAVMSLQEIAPPKIESVATQEMTRALAWQPRQLEFNDTPLAQVVAEFNGDNRIKMVVDDPLLASVPVGASLRSDNVEGFVHMLEASFNVKAERRPDGVIVLRRAN